MYLLPKTVIKKVDVVRKRFFWQGGGTKRKYHLIKWSRICKTRRKGGLGVKDQRKRNIGLLCKWWWTLERGEGLWHEIARKNYLKNSCVSHLKRKQSNSPSWNDLLSIRDNYLRGRKIRIGKGTNADFWQDAWCGNTPINEKFPALFEICNEQKITVAKIAQRNWRLTFRCWLDAELQEQWRTLE